MGGETPPAGESPPTGEPELAPESKKKDMNILIENNLIEGAQMINLGQAQQSLGEMSKELDKLLNT